jgi:hypothetical protein
VGAAPRTSKRRGTHSAVGCAEIQREDRDRRHRIGLGQKDIDEQQNLKPPVYGQNGQRKMIAAHLDLMDGSPQGVARSRHGRLRFSSVFFFFNSSTQSQWRKQHPSRYSGGSYSDRATSTIPRRLGNCSLSR